MPTKYIEPEYYTEIMEHCQIISFQTMGCNVIKLSRDVCGLKML